MGYGGKSRALFLGSVMRSAIKIKKPGLSGFLQMETVGLEPIHTILAKSHRYGRIQPI